MVDASDILNARILVVDDQQANVQLLEQMLLNAGYVCVTSTQDPTEVCELYQRNRYDLILLDLQMPGFDCFQVMEALKAIETESYVPVLVITALPGHKLRALEAGAKDFIAKPFDLVEVRTRIHNMLEVRLLNKKLQHFNKVLENYNQMLGQTVLNRTAELQACNARANRLNALSSDWYWEQDENGHFTRVYGPVLEMLGIRVDDTQDNKKEEQGTRWNETERKILAANLADRRPFLNFVYSRIAPDGSLQYLMASGEPMFDSSGRFTGYRGTGKDVTETMLLRKQLPVNRSNSVPPTLCS